MRRVVVTGMGLVTPLGTGVETVWSRLIDGQSGLNRIETFDISDLTVHVAGQVPRGDGSDGTLNPDPYFAPKEQRKVDDYIT
ncbi:MAG: beta-ketoacyl synthase N-terminal-like domain-containing protein, partial [Hyphomicrobiales bacterium]